MVKTFIPGEFLTADDLNSAFDDCIQLSSTLPQQMQGTLNAPSLSAAIAITTQQLIVTGDLLCSSHSALTLPVGGTLDRPNVPTFGMLRANSDAGTIECRLASGKWATFLTQDAISTPTTTPLNLAAPAFGQATSNAIPLGWLPPSGGTPPYTYSVQFRPAGTSNWQTWVQQTVDTSTTVSGLLPATRYEFLIEAFNAAGNTSSPVVGTNTLGFLPNGPTNLTASQATSTTMSLAWVPLSQTAAYQVQYAPVGDSFWTLFDGPIIDANCTVTGLVPNTSYNFQVVAKVLGSTFDSLVVQSATTIAATVSPNAATALTIANLTASGWTLSWTPPVTGTQPLSYQAQFQLAGTATWTTSGQPTTGQSVTFANMDSGSAYSLRVVTTNSRGTSTSATASVTTLAVTPTVGSIAGTQNSGPGYPYIIAPFDGAVKNGSALSIVGVSMIDPDAIYLAGTMVLKVSCTSGTVTMTDATHSQIQGSGTNTIQYVGTYASINAALASLVYTAQTVGNDSVSIVLTDQLVRQASLLIDMSMVDSGSVIPISPPPNPPPPTNMTATGQPTDINGTTTSRVRSFLDGIGINVRLEDVAYNSNYTQTAAATIENMIGYLGGGHMKLIREACGLNINPSWLAQISSNVGAKYVFTIGRLVTPSNYSAVLQNMLVAVETFPTSVAAFEGVYGADTTGNLAAAVQFQIQVYTNAHSAGLPAWQMAPQTFSNNGFGQPAADLSNTSVFPPFNPNGPSTGTPSVDSNGYLFDAAQAALTNVNGALPEALSMFGWQSFPDGSINTGLGLVNETTQATYILETLFSAFKFGLRYYMIGELLDVPAGSSVENVGQTLGLFNVFGTQKVSAVAIHNLFSWLGDSTASAISFAPGKLNYTIGNKPGATGPHTGYQDVLFQRSAGDFWIVMWNEQTLNTFGLNNNPITVQPVNITLTFNEGAKSQVNIYDPLASSIVKMGSTLNTTISLPSHPIFVQVIY